MKKKKSKKKKSTKTSLEFRWKVKPRKTSDLEIYLGGQLFVIERDIGFPKAEEIESYMEDFGKKILAILESEIKRLAKVKKKK